MGNLRVPFLPETLYHVYNHGNSGDNIFRCDENFRYFLMKYDQYISPIAATFAYCLMPNHFHFAIKIKDEQVLREIYSAKLATDPQGFKNLADLISRTFGNFLNAYAKAFNKMYDRRGSLFLDNIKRKRIEDDQYFTKLIHYIHFNPVHHGFTKEIEDWPHSSYHAFVSDKDTKLQRQYVLDWFDGQTHFAEVHRQVPDIKFE